MTDADCGGGGACVITLGGATLAGQCLATCESMTDCRDGYQCSGGLMGAGVTLPDTCRPAPETDQLDDNVAGNMCAADTDCSGGMCLTSRMMGFGTVELPGGYCSGRCIEDADCGAGGVCLPPLLGGAGSCYQACTDDAQCTRDGYRCRVLRGETRGCNPAPDPLPDNTTGDACTSDAECGGVVGACQTELPATGLAGVLGQTVPAPGGYCSQECAEDSDCGAGGLCTGGVLGNAYCFKPCTGQTECRDGYLCDVRGGGGDTDTPSDAGTDAGPPAPTVCSPEPPTDEDAGT
jgi:Cys-rich repeat protein